MLIDSESGIFFSRFVQRITHLHRLREFLDVKGVTQTLTIFPYVFEMEPYAQGSPRISETTQVDFFFSAIRDPPPLQGQKGICQKYSKKNTSELGILRKKYTDFVSSSTHCVVPLPSRPIKPYVHALCVHGAHNAISSERRCN